MQAIGLTRPGFDRIGAPAGLSLVPGAIAYWDCTQVVGQVLPDLSGNGNHGQLGSTAGADTNDPTAGATGLVLTSDDYIKSAISSLPPPFSITILFSMANPAPGATAFLIGLPSDSGRSFAFSAGAGAVLHCGTSAARRGVTIPAGTSLLTVTVPTDASEVKCYLGAVDATLDNSGDYWGGSGSTLYIGARSGLSPIPSATIHAFKIHPFTLSAAQIAQNHAYFRAKFAPLGVILP
jgi:hypothetical protein